MKSLRLALLLCSFALCGITSVPAQDLSLEADKQETQKYLNTITSDELREHLTFIASDDFEGRETGERGQKMAADYIARHFFDRGLTGPVADNPNPYFQKMEFISRSIREARLGNDNHQLTYPEDFMVSNNFSQPAEEVELVFAGYAIDREEYSDLEGLDLEGKAAVIIDGAPRDEDGQPLFSDLKGVQQRIGKLFERGASYIVLTYPTQEEFRSKFQLLKGYFGQPALYLKGDEPQLAQKGYFVAAPEALAQLFGISSRAYFKTLEKAAKKQEPAGGAFATRVTMEADLEDRRVTSENVLGYLEGTDLKEELIVLTAHYDHVGINEGEVYNGADDDGSGTVGLLEIVDAFAQAAEAGDRPRRSVLFMTVTGEEKGLFGSKYYTQNPIFPLEQTVTNLNVDMIGRIDPDHQEEEEDYVYIIGSNMLSTDLHRIHTAVSQTYFPDFLMDYRYNTKDDPNRFYYRSDHYNFAKNNIPVIFYFNGTHEDYHQASDTPDKIEYELLARRAQLIFATAWEIANRDQRPAVDKAPQKSSSDK